MGAVEIAAVDWVLMRESMPDELRGGALPRRL